MKNTIKIIAIATIVTVAIMISCAYAMPACAEHKDHGEFFPQLTVVVGYEHIGTDLWLIECMDKDGEVWSFYGEEEDAHIGNIFNLLLWDLGEAEEDIEVVEAYFEGRMTDEALGQWMAGDWQ